MFLFSILPILGSFIQKALMAALATRPAAALVSTWQVHLFTAGPTPITNATLPAAFTEATFVGYSAQAAPMSGSPINLPSAAGIGQLSTVLFSCTAATTPNNILGYFVEDAGNNFIMGEYFTNVVPVVNAGDFVDLSVVFPEPNSVLV